MVAALRARRPDLHLYGVGGPRMAAAGVERVADAEELASTLTSLAQGTTSRPKTTGHRTGSKKTSASTKAAELFHAGKAPYLIVTGGNQPWSTAQKSEAELIRDLLVKWKVPREVTACIRSHSSGVIFIVSCFLR